MRTFDAPPARVLLVAVTVAASLLVSPARAAADVVVVTTTADGVAGSLRQVITDANARAGADTINLAAGAVYSLDFCGDGSDEDDNVRGDLDARGGALTITTPTGAPATIDQDCPGQRVIDNVSSSQLTLRRVIVRGGRPAAAGNGGGGVRTASTPLLVEGSTITDNRVPDGVPTGSPFNVGANGGGIASSGGAVTILGSTVSDNHAGNGAAGSAITGLEFGGAGGAGGGVFSTGPVTVVDSTIASNTAGDGGPGTTAFGGFIGGSGGPGGSGGGVFSGGTVTISGSTLVGNEAGVGGAGAVGPFGQGGNPPQAGGAGGSGGPGGAGGGVRATGALSITNSTLSGNTAGDGGAGGAGGQGGFDTSGSNPGGSGGPGAPGGAGGSGANLSGAGDVTLVHVTSTDGTTGLGGAGGAGGPGGSGTPQGTPGEEGADGADGAGGGVAAPSTWSARASVIALQVRGSDCLSPAETDVLNASSDASCGFEFLRDTPRAALALGALAANGGRTQTRLPGPPSVLIERIPAAQCPSNVDQRGIARPQGDRCDLGAVERDFVADMTVTVDSTTAAVAGRDIIYVVVVRNDGPDPSFDATLRDTVPAQLQSLVAIAPVPAGWSCPSTPTPTGGVLQCVRHKLPTATSQTLRLRGRVAPATPRNTQLRNTVQVVSDSRDPRATGNADTDTDVVQTEANLRIVKVAPAQVAAGQTISYTLQTTNLGPSRAAAIVVSDAVPSPVQSLVSVSASPGVACPSQPTTTGGTLKCTKAALDPGQTVSVVLRGPASVGTLVVNTASVASGTADPATANNTSTSRTTVEPPSDVRIVKTAPAGNVAAGADVMFSLTVSNLGPADVRQVTVTDVVPVQVQGATVVSKPVGWTCTPAGAASAGTTIRCTKASMASGETGVIQIRMTLRGDASGTLENVGRVGAPLRDPVPANNVSKVRRTIQA